MFVVVSCSSPAAVRLEDAANCRELYVTSTGCPDSASLARTLVLAGAGMLADGGAHVWLSVDWLRLQGSVSQPPPWMAEFAGMLDYAKTKGWLDETGEAVRAHLQAD